ncbi:MAG: 3-oxoadipate enol-lactonase [Pseudomonadota bacterium]
MGVGLKVNGVVLHAEATGPSGAPAIVFSNSLGTDFRIWDPLLPHLPGGWRVIRYDKRGHGLSEMPTAPWSIEDLADDLAALIEAYGAGPAVVVGLSVGGLIAQGLAARHPQLTRAIVLCDTGAKIGSDSIWNPRIEAVETDGVEAIAGATMERWFTPAFRADAERLTPWHAMMARTPARGYATTARAIRDTDYRAATAKLTLPAMAICGEADGATPPELVRQTAALIPGCPFHIIENAGHIPCVEQPAALGALISDFVMGL